MMARRQIERCQIAVLVVDAAQGVTSGDMAIAGTIWELGRAAVVAINKWDLLDEEARERLELSWSGSTSCSPIPSASTSRRSPAAASRSSSPPSTRRSRRYNLRLGTGRGQPHLRAAVEHPSARRRSTASRGSSTTPPRSPTAPPTFMLFANRTLPRNDPYRRYLENRLREELDLAGVPVRLVIRQRG